MMAPGGRLDSRPDAEYLRNSVYRLVNAENLDASLDPLSAAQRSAVPAIIPSFRSRLNYRISTQTVAFGYDITYY